jgi:tetratricopeptide (TPR) repeat protein
VYVALARVWLDAADRPDRAAVGKALEAIEVVVRRPSPSSEALALQGRALVLANDLESAERVLLQAVDRFPADPDAFLQLAIAAQRLGHLQLARGSLLRHAILWPTSGEARRAREIGWLSVRLGEPDVAVTWFKRALAVSGPEAALLGELADAHWRAGNAEAAASALARGLELDPQDRNLRALQARIR